MRGSILFVIAWVWGLESLIRTAPAQTPPPNATLKAGTADHPDPRALLKRVADARNRIVSGEVELQVSRRQLEFRPGWRDSQTRLTILFDGQKHRTESLGREFAYYLMGNKTDELTHAKMKELGLDNDQAVAWGLFTGFDARYVSIRDGDRLWQYRVHGQRQGTTTIEDPSEGSSVYAFDPRILGISSGFFTTATVDTCLFLNRTNEPLYMGEENLEGRRAWRVRVLLEGAKDPWPVDFWIDAEHPERVLRLESPINQTTVDSKFDDTSDPLPIEITMIDRRLERRMVRGKSRYNIQVDPDTWGLHGLKMAVGTDVIDRAQHKRIGYWDGERLTDELPRGIPRAPPERAPNLDKLLDLVAQDPLSAFSIRAITRVLLYEPLGPEVDRAVELFKQHQVRGEGLAELCHGLGETWRDRPWAVDALQSVLAHQPDIETLAHACLALATLLKNSGRDEFALNEAELLFQRVQDNYPTVAWEGKNLAEKAAQGLAEIRSRPRLGHIAPDIVGIDLDGNQLKLSDHKGKVVVLSFWASWCAPCIKKIPMERDLVAKMAGQPFVLLGVNGDAERAKAAELVRKEKITWPSFQDGGPNGRIAAFWGVQALPATFILDGQQRIRFRNVPAEDLEKTIRGLLREIPPDLR